MAYNPFINNSNNFNFQPPQQMFPPSQGNVYTINNAMEVANVPASSGLTVALCLTEGLMYIKSIQNGQPMFWAYKMVPYQEEEKKNVSEERLTALETKVANLIKELKGE